MSSKEKYYKAHKKPDRNETVTQEPVLKSSDKPSDIDWKAIDLFDKIYGTQWEWP